MIQEFKAKLPRFSRQMNDESGKLSGLASFRITWRIYVAPTIWTRRINITWITHYLKNWVRNGFGSIWVLWDSALFLVLKRFDDYCFKPLCREVRSTSHDSHGLATSPKWFLVNESIPSSRIMFSTFFCHFCFQVYHLWRLSVYDHCVLAGSIHGLVGE